MTMDTLICSNYFTGVTEKYNAAGEMMYDNINSNVTTHCLHYLLYLSDARIDAARLHINVVHAMQQSVIHPPILPKK